MPRTKLPEHLRKAGLKITADKDVVEAAHESGNASAWFNEAGKDRIRRDSKSTERTGKEEESMNANSALRNTFAEYEESVEGLDYFLTNEATSQFVLKNIKSGQKYLSLVIDEDASSVKTVLLIPAGDGQAKTDFANGRISYRRFIELSSPVGLGYINQNNGVFNLQSLSVSGISDKILSNLEHSCDFVSTKEWFDRRMSRFSKRFG